MGIMVYSLPSTVVYILWAIWSARELKVTDKMSKGASSTVSKARW